MIKTHTSVRDKRVIFYSLINKVLAFAANIPTQLIEKSQASNLDSVQ